MASAEHPLLRHEGQGIRGNSIRPARCFPNVIPPVVQKTASFPWPFPVPLPGRRREFTPAGANSAPRGQNLPGRCFSLWPIGIRTPLASAGQAARPSCFFFPPELALPETAQAIFSSSPPTLRRGARRPCGGGKNVLVAVSVHQVNPQGPPGRVTAPFERVIHVRRPVPYTASAAFLVRAGHFPRSPLGSAASKIPQRSMELVNHQPQQRPSGHHVAEDVINVNSVPCPIRT